MFASRRSITNDLAAFWSTRKHIQRIGTQRKQQNPIKITFFSQNMSPKSTALKIYVVKIPLSLKNDVVTQVVGYRKDAVKCVFEYSVHHEKNDKHMCRPKGLKNVQKKHDFWGIFFFGMKNDIRQKKVNLLFLALFESQRSLEHRETLSSPNSFSLATLLST